MAGNQASDIGTFHEYNLGQKIQVGEKIFSILYEIHKVFQSVLSDVAGISIRSPS